MSDGAGHGRKQLHGSGEGGLCERKIQDIITTGSCDSKTANFAARVLYNIYKIGERKCGNVSLKSDGVTE